MMIRFAAIAAASVLVTACVSTAQFPPPRGDYGDPGIHIAAMVELLDDAHEQASQASSANSISEIKQRADTVYAHVWGQSSGLVERTGAALVPGWKTRWQVTYTDFDPAFGQRYGSAPPEITDPSDLGIAGRGRYVRRTLTAELDQRSREEAILIEQLIAALNNVIGWMRIDDGVTKAERQPRVDLTYQWDAPKSFWQSSADTGWLFEVQSQALNILKTDYGTDLASAQRHAQGLVALLETVRDGNDADQNGRIGASRMEGGLLTVQSMAQQAGLL
jgi:hypothetical protein